MSEYPLFYRAAETLRSATGKKLDEITLEGIEAGEVTMADLRISAETLVMQAEIAEKANRPQLGQNLRRAAELVDVPEEKILEIYQTLRPGRATPAELERLAAELEDSFNAPLSAKLLRASREQNPPPPPSEAPDDDGSEQA